MISNFKETITKINSGIIKIPTLIGMGVLLLGLAGGVYLVSQNQTLQSKAAISSQPKNVNTANLSESSVSIYWQTDQVTTGFIRAGTTQQSTNIYLDDRDPSSPQPHKLHFVTISNLQPETTYYYQIYSGTIIYPPTFSSFKTPAIRANLNWPPIVGTIIDINNQAIDEAIITLNLPEAQTLATIAKTGGNFILPISDIKTADLTNPLPNQIYTAKLDILGTSKTAQAVLSMPPTTTALPPIVLGSSVDLTQPGKTLPFSAPNISTSSTEINSYDLNRDGVVDFADLSIVLQNFGTTANAKNPNADLNKDGVIDQKDTNLITSYLK